jgi:tryptophan synthase alpha subunit
MVKKIRPQLTIAAGMGIKTASDISKISAIPDIDAVIVGTSLLQAIGEGKAARVSFLNEIEGSLHRSNNS